MIEVTKKIIESVYGSTIYYRGAAYFTSGQVVELELLEVEKNCIRFTSKVVNGNGKKYTQEVTIKKNAKPSLSSTCSCPYESNCKHGAAALLQYIADFHGEFEIEEPLSGSKEEIIAALKGMDAFKVGEKELTQAYQMNENHMSKLKIEEEKRIKNSPANHWLTLLEEEKSLVSEGQLPEEFAIYELNKAHWNDTYILTPYITKHHKKNGTINVGRMTTFSGLAFKYNRHFLTKKDLPLIEMAETAPSYYNEGVMIKGKIGYLLLIEALITERCFYQRNRRPLKLSPEKLKLEIKWKKIKSGHKLKFSIPLDSLVIPTLPLMRIDPLEGCIYEIESSITLDEWKLLAKIPEISEDTLAQTQYRLERLFPYENIERPKELKSQVVTEPLHVVIKVYSTGSKNAMENEMMVQFCYGRYRFSQLAQKEESTIEEQGNFITIKRDMIGEKAAFQHLFSLQLEQSSEGSSKFRFPHHLKGYDICFLWDKFLNCDVEFLESLGYEVIFDGSFTLEFDLTENIYVESTKLDWFSLQFSLEIEGKKYNLLPMVASLLETLDLTKGEEEIEKLPELLYLEADRGKYCKVKKEEILPIIKTILQLYGQEKKGDTLEVLASEAHLVENLNHVNINWKGSREILELSEKLKNFQKLTEVTAPKELSVELRSYQAFGLTWLNFLHEFGFSGILADDMGLGKTIQTLAHLSRLKEEGKLTKPSLLIVPTSLIGNWKNEIKKFTPSLDYLVLHGKDRKVEFEEISNHTLIITTYTLAMRDSEAYKEYEFEYIILDEAQKIKNSGTKLGVAIRDLKSKYRLALSGTPIENHLGELWSIFHFLMPGFLKSRERFNKEYRKPIEQTGDRETQARLNRRLAPFILRRTKEHVATELPEKSVIIKVAEFEEKQAKLYEGVRLALEKRVRDVVQANGIAKSSIIVLDALLKLRQICCHPQLLKIDEAKKVKESAKFELFKDLLAELLEEKRKILVFSQFTEMLAIIESYVETLGVSYAKLTGSTLNREGEIEKFTRGEASIFLISLKAGGVGLNLVEADTVIHYDPWWNPAVENQATDRAHRIGQDKKVFVYKLIVENSIESKILELQKRKKLIQEGIYDSSGENRVEKLSGDELVALLKG